jgi:hypothetical protein
LVALFVVAWIVLLMGIMLPAMFIRRATGNARVKSGPAQTVVSTPVVTSTVVVTRSGVVVSTMDGAVTSSMEVVATSARSTAVATETVGARKLG